MNGRKLWIGSTVAAVVLSLPGCVEKQRALSPAEKEQLEALRVRGEPAPKHRLAVNFEGKVRLLGYDMEPEGPWKPGETRTVTWYWKVEEPLEEGWRLFTHLEGNAGNVVNHDGTGPLRSLYPPGRWKKGEVLKDPQRIELPADWKSPTATFYLGLWLGPHRLQITEGPNDGDNRARVLTVPVARGASADTAPRPPAVPVLQAPKTATPPTIDGKLDDEVWKAARPTRRFVNTLHGTLAEPKATARVAWDEANLYVAFEVADDFLVSDFTEHDQHLWKKDAVEIMLDPDGDGRNYFEIQVSPRGVVFDTRYDTRRQPRPFGHVDWNSQAKAAVAVDGKVGDGAADKGYTVEIAIPWTAFQVGEPPAERPRPNLAWRINFYVMDSRRDGGQRAVGWSPPRVGDFHVPARFGRVVFRDPSAPQPAQAQQARPVPALRPEALEGIRQHLRRLQLGGAKAPTDVPQRPPRIAPGQKVYNVPPERAEEVRKAGAVPVPPAR